MAFQRKKPAAIGIKANYLGFIEPALATSITTVRKTQPYSKRIAHRGIWIEPSLLAEIEYRAKSAEGKVRHPLFKGLREDL